MLQILPSSAWVEYRGAPKSKTLNEGAIHFAIVKGADGQEHKCVVKLIDLSSSPGLLCEGLGWLLAQAAGVKVPAFAAVLRVPLVELGKSMILPAFVAGYHEYLAWCVEVVEGNAVAQINRWMFWLARVRCLYAKNTPVIAAFDYWADNQDRNYGNVIRSRDGQYIAIDHESLLHDAVWRKYYGMEFALYSLLQEAQLRLPAGQLHRFKCDMALAAEKHATAIQAVKPAGVKFVSDIVPDPAFSAQLWIEIETFLTLRAQIGWLAGELGVIV